MSKKTDIEAWITAAAGATNPLIFQVATGVYEAYAPLVLVPHVSGLYSGQRSGVAADRARSKGEQFKFRGITTAVSTTKPTWDVTDIATLRTIFEADALEQGGISMYRKAAKTVVEEAKAEPVVQDAPEPEAEVVETPDLEGMTKKQLDAWALTQGIDVDGRLSKKDMLEFVQAELTKK